MSANDSNAWHSGIKLNLAAKMFHSRYTLLPNKRTSRANLVNTRFMDIIEAYLKQRKVISNLECTKNIHEGANVQKRPGGGCIELDALAVMTDGQNLDVTDISPGYAQLSARRGFDDEVKGILCYKGSLVNSYVVSRFFCFFTHLYFKLMSFAYDEYELRYVDAEKVRDKLFRHLKACINGSWEMKNRVKLRKHGSTVRMNVYENCCDVPVKLFSVDIAPSLVVDGQYYVAKPFKNMHDSSYCWRKIFIDEDKQKLENCGAFTHCRKQVLRILKVICDHEPELQKLSSYHLKTALFMEYDKNVAWTCNAIGERVMGVLQQLYSAMRKRHMPHYNIRELNLLNGIHPLKIEKMRDRIHSLLTCEDQMMILLTPPQLDCSIGYILLSFFVASLAIVFGLYLMFVIQP